MDPVSLMIGAMVLAAFIVERLPEAMSEAEYAKRGEISPAYAARLKRLADAGIDPATGGPMRQYLANAWRDSWLDLDNDRQRARAARLGKDSDTSPGSEPSGPGWWRTFRARLAEQLDQAAADHANRWRTRTPKGEGDPTTGPVTSKVADPSRPAPTPGPDGHPDPDYPTGWTDDPVVDEVIHDYDTPYQPGDPGNADEQPSPGPPGPTDQREPIRVTATVGAPLRGPDPEPTQSQQPTLEGAVMSNSLASIGTPVTGVLSGAAEARAIARQLEAANAAYVAQLQRLRTRIASLGEQTAAIVQLSLRSQTVNLIVQAAEAAAAAQAAAKSCGAEVTPLMHSVALSFDRLNS